MDKAASSFSSDLSLKFKRLSFVAIVMIVYLHNYANGLYLSNPGFNAWMQDLVSQGLTRMAVPYFFIVSGFFLFRNYPEEGVVAWWRRQIAKRVPSLVIPYFIWGVLSLAITYTIVCFATIKLYTFEWQSFSWWMRVLGVIDQNPLFAYHLWYVKALFIAVILSPILGWIIKKGMGWWLIAIAFIFCLLPMPLYGYRLCLLFFSLGALLSRTKLTKISSLLDSHSRIAGMVACAVWIAVSTVHIYVVRGAISCRMNFLLFGNCAGLLACWCLYDSVPNRFWRGVDRIAGCSFFIYCAHFYCYTPLGKVLGCLPKNIIPSFVAWLMSPVLIILFLVLVWTLMKRYSPRVLSVISGGRV